MFKLGLGQDIGIDLGTATVIAYVKGKGVVLREPSVVAVDSNTKEVLAVGQEARRMLGRTPGNIVATRPLREGVISDYTVTEKMLKYFINKVNGKTLFSPRTMICIPSRVTEVEKKAVVDAATQAGARKVFLIEEPIAADISDKGIYMTGGGCLVDGLDRLLQEKTGINVMIANDAVSCVALGTGKALDNLDALDK